MKKVLILLVCIIAGATIVPAKTVVPVKPQGASIGPKITIEIEIGRRKRDCKGLGICKISIDGKVTNWENEPSRARAVAWMEGGKLRVEFDKNTIESGTFQTFFAGDYFKMEEEFDLPAEVASALGISSYTIKTGNYPFAQSSEGNILPVTF